MHGDKGDHFEATQSIHKRSHGRRFARHCRKLGQAFGVFGLTARVVPALTAVDATLGRAMLIWGVWVLGYAATTTAVHPVIAKQKRQSRKAYGAIFSSIALSSAILLLDQRETLGLAPVPMIFASCYFLVAPPPAKRLRQVGRALVASTLASASIFIAAKASIRHFDCSSRY